MTLLYRLFYTTVSLSMLMTVLAPLTLVLRLFLHRHEKKFTLRIWGLFYFRSVCPIALSSAFCMFPAWNRQYHLLLANMGLTIQNSPGIMRSWRTVFSENVSASVPFAVCSVIWAAGFITGTIFVLFRRHRLSKQLQSAHPLGECIYESEILSAPLTLGLKNTKRYLPKDFHTKELACLLHTGEVSRFYALRTFLTGIITLIHWFNPVMWLCHRLWLSDAAIDIDERCVFHGEEAVRKEYAQNILNFKKDASVKSKSFFWETLLNGKAENQTEKRAVRMLYQKWDTKTDTLILLLLLSLLFIFCFLLSPIRLAWQKGTQTHKQSTQESLFSETTTCITKMKTTSPEGLERIIQLEMISGHKKGNGYEGDFIICMYDSIENEIASYRLSDAFPDIDKKKLYFPENITLCINDYNGDNTQELVLGQQTEIPDNLKEDAKGKEYLSYQYVLLSLEDTVITLAGKDISAVSPSSELGASITFEQPEDIDDVFIVPMAQKKLYYVWNPDTLLYEKREMTEEALKAHKDNAKNTDGETQEHTLKTEDGTEAMLVTTKKDSTQSEAIQSVILFPRKQSKKLESMKGYYCDLLWVTDMESAKQRYAQVIYNGTQSQTFSLYDLQRKTIAYRHEDGTQCLSDIFKQYKEDDITFEEHGAVIYSLTDKNGDVITISFAADADEGITVKGSYDYDILKKTASNLTFSRTETKTDND